MSYVLVDSVRGHKLQVNQPVALPRVGDIVVAQLTRSGSKDRYVVQNVEHCVEEPLNLGLRNEATLRVAFAGTIYVFVTRKVVADTQSTNHDPMRWRSGHAYHLSVQELADMGRFNRKKLAQMLGIHNSVFMKSTDRVQAQRLYNAMHPNAKPRYTKKKVASARR